MNRIIALILLPLLFFSCGTHRKAELSKKGKESIYFIRTALVNDKDTAFRLADSLLSRTEDKVYVIENDKAGLTESYSVEAGDYNSSYLAGRKAYELKAKGIIKDYSIIINNAEVHNDFPDVYFVGAHRSGVPSVYKYDIISRKLTLFWSKPDEIVVDLSPSADRRSIFILTATEYGKKTIFPYINDVRLYRINSSSQEVEELRDLGSGIQIFSRWDSPNTFRIIFNSFDKKKSTFVVQNTFDFNSNGKLLSSEKKIFDIVKEKYPVIAEASMTFSSTDNNFRCAVTSKNGRYIYTIFNGNDSAKDILESQLRLNQTQWTEDNRYCILSTNDVTPKNKTLGSLRPETSRLLIVSTKSGKIRSDWKGAGYKNFILQGDLLFFDSGFNNSSKIYVYDISENKLVDTIKVAGGCGIRYIPRIQY